MKHLIILTMIMIGWATNLFAQADYNQFTEKGKLDPPTIDKTLKTSGPSYDAGPPAYMTSGHIYNITLYDKLRHLFGYRGKNQNVKFLTVNQANSLPMSKFQVLVDEKGNIIDCTLLESTNPGKDNTVLSYLPEKKFYDEMPSINGEPCKMVVILSFRYHQNGNFDIAQSIYPLQPLPDTVPATTASDN